MILVKLLKLQLISSKPKSKAGKNKMKSQQSFTLVEIQKSWPYKCMIKLLMHSIVSTLPKRKELLLVLDWLTGILLTCFMNIRVISKSESRYWPKHWKLPEENYSKQCHLKNDPCSQMDGSDLISRQKSMRICLSRELWILLKFAEMLS